MTELERLTSELLCLPAEQRAELVEILLQSLEEEEDKDVKSAWLTEIHRRDREIRSGEATCKPADQVLIEARKRLRCIK